MLRRLLLLIILVPTLSADPRQEIYDLLGSMASGLSEGTPSQFLDAFDRSMKGYTELAANIRAMVAQRDVLSSIDLVDDAGDDQARTVRVDWLLQLANRQNSAAVERRQKTVVLKLEKQKRKWRIVWLEPLDFFAPPRIDRE